MHTKHLSVSKSLTLTETLSDLLAFSERYCHEKKSNRRLPLPPYLENLQSSWSIFRFVPAAVSLFKDLAHLKDQDMAFAQEVLMMCLTQSKQPQEWVKTFETWLDKKGITVVLNVFLLGYLANPSLDINYAYMLVYSIITPKMALALREKSPEFSAEKKFWTQFLKTFLPPYCDGLTNPPKRLADFLMVDKEAETPGIFGLAFDFSGQDRDSFRGVLNQKLGLVTNYSTSAFYTDFAQFICPSATSSLQFCPLSMDTDSANSDFEFSQHIQLRPFLGGIKPSTMGRLFFYDQTRPYGVIHPSLFSTNLYDVHGGDTFIHPVLWAVHDLIHYVNILRGDFSGQTILSRGKQDLDTWVPTVLSGLSELETVDDILVKTFVTGTVYDTKPNSDLIKEKLSRVLLPFLTERLLEIPHGFSDTAVFLRGTLINGLSIFCNETFFPDMERLSQTDVNSISRQTSPVFTKIMGWLFHNFKLKLS